MHSKLGDTDGYKMRVRGRMVVERTAKSNKTIDNLAAKIELAAQNKEVLRMTINNQEARRDGIGEQQEEEEAAIEELKEKIEGFTREGEARMGRIITGTNWLERIGRSAVVNAFPVQKNLQLRTILEGDRPTFPEQNLPTSALLPTAEEKTKQEKEREKMEKDMNEELEDRENNERELLAMWTEEDNKLECMGQLIDQYFQPQLARLVKQRNLEILRRDELAGVF